MGDGRGKTYQLERHNGLMETRWGWHSNRCSGKFEQWTITVVDPNGCSDEGHDKGWHSNRRSGKFERWTVTVVDPNECSDEGRNNGEDGCSDEGHGKALHGFTAGLNSFYRTLTRLHMYPFRVRVCTCPLHIYGIEKTTGFTKPTVWWAYYDNYNRSITIK
jgi:hypothetical protein